MPDFTTQVWNNERIYMVEFARAKTGGPHMKFPDPDDVGFQDDAFPDEHGPIVSSSHAMKDIRVKFLRTEISTSAPLFITSTDKTIAKITDPADGKLAATRQHIVKFSTINAGRCAFEVHYKWADGPVIGRLYVKVYQRRDVPLRLHLLTVNGAANPANFFGKNCPTTAAQEARLKWFIRQVNHAWIPHGIFLKPEASVYQTAWTNAHIGSGSVSPNYNEMIMGGALSPNRSAAAVNVYVFGQWTAGTMMALGIPVAWAKQRNYWFPPAAAPPAVRHLSNAVYLRSSQAVDPLVVAHEFGHYVELCKLDSTGAVQQWHSTGDTVGGAPGSRDDLLSRRRTMYPIVVLQQSNFAWRNDTGYGPGKMSGLFTQRRLAQDITIEESSRAWTAAGGANFYAI